MKIVNLAAHDVHLVDADGAVIRTFEQSGVTARAAVTTEQLGAVDGVPLARTRYGAPTDLPEPEEGVLLIVSILTIQAAAAVGRVTSDLFAPADLVRDSRDRVIGCRALATL